MGITGINPTAHWRIEALDSRHEAAESCSVKLFSLLELLCGTNGRCLTWRARRQAIPKAIHIPFYTDIEIAHHWTGTRERSLPSGKKVF